MDKEELIKNIKGWIHLDEEIKDLQRQIKEKRNETIFLFIFPVHPQHIPIKPFTMFPIIIRNFLSSWQSFFIEPIHWLYKITVFYVRFPTKFQGYDLGIVR